MEESLILFVYSVIRKISKRNEAVQTSGLVEFITVAQSNKLLFGSEWICVCCMLSNVGNI